MSSPIIIDFRTKTMDTVKAEIRGSGPQPISPLGLPTVGTLRLDQLIEKSGVAIDRAMEVIKVMGEKLSETVTSIAKPPSEVELEFGFSFDIEAGAIIARTSAEASMSVHLKWTANSSKPERQT